MLYCLRRFERARVGSARHASPATPPEDGQCEGEEDGVRHPHGDKRRDEQVVGERLARSDAGIVHTKDQERRAYHEHGPAARQAQFQRGARQRQDHARGRERVLLVDLDLDEAARARAFGPASALARRAAARNSPISIERPSRSVEPLAKIWAWSNTSRSLCGELSECSTRARARR